MSAVSIQTQDQSVRIVFDPALSIACARELRDQFDPILSGSESIVFDASRVERIDAAIVQLIAAFVAGARKRHLGYRWESHSSAFRNAASLLGLSDMLEVPA
jgi:anti-anti-sigma regulatory factor